MSAGPRFRVGICGGGIGGLTLAVALSKYADIDITIYESAHKLTEVGAGLGLFSRPWDVIRILGLEADLLAFTDSQPQKGPVPSIRYRKSDQHNGFDFFTLVTQGNLIRLHRADFQATLLRHLPKTCKIYCSKRLASYVQRASGVVDMLFEDGSKAQCDILVGADGYKSAVRRCMLEEKARSARQAGRPQESAEHIAAVNPLWDGTVCYRALIPTDLLRAKYPHHPITQGTTQYLGKGSHIMAYPIQNGKLINFVAFCSRHDLEDTTFNGPWVGVAPKAEFASQFSHWEREVQEMIDCVENPLRWAIHTVKPMKSFAHGHVVLLGDAAHAMGPYQGAGAGQAVEDAFILATVLGHRRTTRDTLAKALQIHDDIRRPFALWVHERSRQNGRYFSLEDGIDLNQQSQNRLREQLELLGRSMVQNWEWAWTTTLEKSFQEAVRRLDS